MADVTLTVNRVVRAGVSINGNTTAGATGNTYKIDNAQRAMLYAKNTGTGAVTVTFQTPGTVDTLAITDRTATVAGTATSLFGPFSADYEDTSGNVNVTVSAALTIAAFSLY